MSAAAGVHRLIDMVVEEVSLVDRPANKQPFLIVKRDVQMAKSGTKGGKAAPKGKGTKDRPSPDTEDPKDPFEGEDEEGDDEGRAPPKPPAGEKKPAKKAEDGSLLAAALSALEGLTEAVELIATAGEEEAGTELGELAEELGELARRLAQASGATAPDTEGDDADGGAVGKALAAVRETIKRVRAVVAAAERATAKVDTGAPGEGGSGQGAPAAVNKSDEGIAALRAEMKGLREAVQGQQQRIVTLEKGVGLPNSAAADERVRQEDDDNDASWPLDMNKPRDRTSVDKSISFHDEE